MQEVALPIWSFIVGLILLLGGIGTIVTLLSKMTAKAAKDAVQQSDIDNLKSIQKKDFENLKEDLKNYVRKEVFEAVKHDMEGIGRKVSHLDEESRRYNERFIELESKVLEQLKTLTASNEELKNLLIKHISMPN